MIFTQEDRDKGVPEQELGSARERGAAANVRWHVRKDGGRVFLDGQTIALRDSDGRLRGYLKIAQDVTARRRGEERQSVLLAKLQHRVRNVLTVVQALVRRTVQGASSVQEVGQQLEGRIRALSRTQTLLTRAAGVGVDLRQIVEDELAAQGAEHGLVSISGPVAIMAPKAAEVLTLAIHELATNSIKYGVLAKNAGALAVSWRVAELNRERSLHILWEETGLALEPAERPKVGFGTELITRRVPYELRGHGSVDLRPEGLRCEMDFPLVDGDSIFNSNPPP